MLRNRNQRKGLDSVLAPSGADESSPAINRWGRFCPVRGRWE